MADKRKTPQGDKMPPGGTPPTQLDIEACRRCELWEQATHGVAGAGPLDSRLMLVGEQPGHDEDLAGAPFVGPAGQLLRGLLSEAGIDANRIFITNAVKHFYHEPRGKRRMHKTPLQRHIAACHEWLEREIARVDPTVIVTLGATALGAVLGRRIAIAVARTRELVNPAGIAVVATYHPSAILRAPDDDAKAVLREALLADLIRAARSAR